MLDIQTSKGFDALNLPCELCSLLKRQGIEIPTPIQEQAIPIALAGQDVIGVANTGTGKTLAFGLPMIVRLKQNEVGLIIAPTRELALQIVETYSQLGTRCVLIVGGASMGQQINQLRNRYQVIVATPGRLIDHLDRRTVNLSNVSMLVLDEADRMLDMGFAPAIRRIIDQVPSQRQTMLFSATMPPEIQELANSYLNNAQRIEVCSAGSTPDSIRQELVIVPFEDKQPVLQNLLSRHHGSVLVFTRTRHGARKIAKAVRVGGHSAAEIHADRTLAQRRVALQGFKDGEYRVLVATDIAARGIDVKDISLVVNFDVPENAEDYIHRIGRTGRAGAQGHSVTIVIPQQSRLVRDIERLMGMRIAVVDGMGDGSMIPTPASTAPVRESRPQEGQQSSNRPSRSSWRDREAPRNDRNGYQGNRPQFNREPRSFDRPAPTQDRPAPSQDRPEAPRDRDDRPAPSQDRPQYNNDRPGYDRPRYNNDRSSDDRPRYNNDRPQAGRDERSYDRPRYGNDRPQSGGYQRPDDRPRYNNDRPQGNGDQRPDDRPRYGNDRPRFNNDRPRPDGPQRSFNGPRFDNDRPRPDGPQRSFDRPRYGNDRPQGGGYQRPDDRPRYNNDRPQSNGDARSYDRPRPSQDGVDRPRYENDRPRPAGDRQDGPARYRDNGAPSNNSYNQPSQDRSGPKKPRWRDDRPRPNGEPRFNDRPASSQDRPPQAGRMDRPYEPPSGAMNSGPKKPKHAARKALAANAGNATPSSKPGHRGWSGKTKKQARSR